MESYTRCCFVVFLPLDRVCCRSMWLYIRLILTRPCRPVWHDMNYFTNNKKFWRTVKALFIDKILSTPSIEFIENER